jgi:hypothetical protein
MSVGEKKTAETGMKTIINSAGDGAKASELELTTANKALVAAKKQAEVLVKNAAKASEEALKQGTKLVAAAQKVVDAATKKHTKAFDAAAKNVSKIKGQIDALNAMPVEPARRGRPPKVEAATA